MCGFTVRPQAFIFNKYPTNSNVNCSTTFEKHTPKCNRIVLCFNLFVIILSINHSWQLFYTGERSTLAQTLVAKVHFYFPICCPCQHPDSPWPDVLSQVELLGRLPHDWTKTKDRIPMESTGFGHQCCRMHLSVLPRLTANTWPSLQREIQK